MTRQTNSSINTNSKAGKSGDGSKTRVWNKNAEPETSEDGGKTYMGFKWKVIGCQHCRWENNMTMKENGSAKQKTRSEKNIRSNAKNSLR